MRVSVVVIGRPRHSGLADAIQDYETRASRYWPLDVVEVKEEPGRGLSGDIVRERESARLADRLPADAVVVALKSRSNPVDEAVSQSLAALAWLQSAGTRQFYFKYCSTFDSTDAGNIGPVAEALMNLLGVDFTIACPAFPTNKRTIYNGYLFVDGQLLSESGMLGA